MNLASVAAEVIAQLLDDVPTVATRADESTFTAVKTHGPDFTLRMADSGYQEIQEFQLHCLATEFGDSVPEVNDDLTVEGKLVTIVQRADLPNADAPTAYRFTVRISG